MMRSFDGYLRLVDACDELSISRGTARELIRCLLARRCSHPTQSPRSLPPSLSSLLKWLLLNTTYRNVVEAIVGKIRYSEQEERRLNKQSRIQDWLWSMNAMSEEGWSPDLELWSIKDVQSFQLAPVQGHEHGNEQPFLMYAAGDLGYDYIWKKIMPGRWQCVGLDRAYVRTKAVDEKRETHAKPTEPCSRLKSCTTSFKRSHASLHSFRLVVKTLTQLTIALNVPIEGATVKELKEAIQDVEGIPADQQRLLFANKLLEDERELYDYEITDESTVYLSLHLRGC